MRTFYNHIMKIISFKAFKNILIPLLLLAFLGGFLWGLNISYNPTSLVSFALWRVFCPALALYFFYLLYLKKNSKIHHKILKEKLQQMGANKWIVKTLGLNYVLFIPLCLTYILNAYLALVSNCLATLSFEELVTVKTISCNHSRRGYSTLTMTALNKKDKKLTTMDAPYSICRDYPNIRQLQGQTIKLYGRHWVLGTIYEGFYTSKKLI